MHWFTRDKGKHKVLFEFDDSYLFMNGKDEDNKVEANKENVNSILSKKHI